MTENEFFNFIRIFIKKCISFESNKVKQRVHLFKNVYIVSLIHILGLKIICSLQFYKRHSTVTIYF